MTTNLASLTTTQAHFLALFFASTYVGSLYISKKTRLAFSTKPLVTNGRYRQKENHERWRDDDDVIRARLVACTASTTLCILTVILVNWRTLGKEVSACLQMPVPHVLIRVIPEFPGRNGRDHATPRTRSAGASYAASDNTPTLHWSAICHVPLKRTSFHVRLVLRYRRPLQVLHVAGNS